MYLQTAMGQCDDTWHVTCDMWHMTCDIWHVTRDTWHMKCDTWWEWKLLLKFQLSSSYGFGRTMFWRIGGKGLLTELINHKGGCREASATPGLLKTVKAVGKQLNYYPVDLLRFVICIWSLFCSWSLWICFDGCNRVTPFLPNKG